MFKLLSLLWLSLVSPILHAQTYTSMPRWSDLYLNLFSQYKSYLGAFTEYEPYQYGVVAGSTLLLLRVDQRFTDHAKHVAHDHGGMAESHQDATLKKWHILGQDVAIRGPVSTTGVFWYFGDGITHALTASAFAMYGYGSGDFKGAHVAKQMVESLLLVGPTVLSLKMATGRESPARATKDAGKWQGYPGFKRYLSDQSKYYSTPSGHTATLVSTLTVIHENYPDVAWIKPTGYVMTGLLMTALMAVGAHWPSDYPLAMAIGYTAGYTTVHENLKRNSMATQEPKPLTWHWHGFSPIPQGIKTSISF